MELEAKGIGIMFLAENEFARIKQGQDNIKESIVRVLFTRKGTRPYLSEFGTNLPNLAFTSNYEDLISIIQFEVEQALDKWEPRVQFLNVELLEIDSTRIAFKINFQNLETMKEDFLELTGDFA